MNVKTNLSGFRYVDVVVDVPAVGDRKFTYQVPEGSALPYGAKVQVPFGRKQTDGYVAGHSSVKPDFDVKSVSAVYDLRFLPPDHLLRLGEVLKEHYLASTASFWGYLWPPLVRRRHLEPGTGFDEPAGCRLLRTKQMPTAPGSFAGSLFIQGPASFRWDYYCAKIKEALDSGLGVIVLVPEIRKIDAAIRALQAWYNGPISLVHSDLPGAARREQWLSLLTGDSMLAVGTRSAAFSPVKNLGLIVVDEEESHLYKAGEFPGYNAVTVARARGNLENCRVLLGSFVPSVKTGYFINKGRLKPVKPSTPGLNVNVTHETISMLGRKRRVVISKELHLALRDIFNDGERAVLFLNRRGTSSSLVCTDCGNTIMCPRCSVSLAYHARDSQMVCHTCGYRRTAPLECPVCRGHTWKPVGYGIDRVVSEFEKRFPGVPVLQLDQDSESPENVIEQFRSSSPSCLLCTQMVLGFEIPPVTGLGVLSCDNLLGFPDYSAPEQVFRLLMNLVHLLKNSGGNQQKRFVVQTLNPQHHAITGVQDPESFYVVESQNRADLNYPPFGALFKIEFSGKNPDMVRQIAEKFAAEAENHSNGVQVLGPGPAPKPRVRGRYRWIIMLKSKKREVLSGIVKQVWPEVSHSQVRMTVDTEEPFGIG
ncbi:MAG TPA: primosomal protein N' [Firmicutes bacterium]|nr:primosomal protein N' [Candidatus Fermentithermobacillaceae bacterium]